MKGTPETVCLTRNPIPLPKMIIEKVHKHSPVEAKLRRQPQSAALKVCISLGERVYLPVQQQPLADSGRVGVIQRALDEIPHEIAHQQFLVVTGKIRVKEKIQ